MDMSVRLISADNVEADHGRVYYLSDDDKRHWIPSANVAVSYGWDLNMVVKLPVDEIYNYPLSFSIARNYKKNKECCMLPYGLFEGINKIEVWGREWFGSQFSGYGLEIGAASTPWPCNVSCQVDYADLFDNDEGCKIGYKNKDFVSLEFKASLEDMSAIKKKYDFIVCSHVIEHTPRVIQALKNIYKHLVEGGICVMVVPHMRHTFDQLREITPLSHHIQDYKNYERGQDVIHLVDYLEKAHIKYQGGTAEIAAHCTAFLNDNKNFDIHYHTFVEDSFAEIIDWFNNNVYGWSSCQIFNRLEGKNEFFVRLVK